ncbi:MAG: pyrroloquinoline quinone biosynthesis protein PqqE [Methanoregula sp. PtaU1.Bin051]|nr:MAG: pyrroloquinoline quinone biosynthesis protein PqqE [Methanoregula sp. PtaU1.Bin051]
MNRITQCLHGKGTVSAVMKHRHGSGAVPGRYLAFSGMRRPVVFWNVTDTCNLACTHCYSGSGPGSGTGDELTTGEARALIDDLAAAKIPLVIFTGGEPVLRPDIWELAKYCKENGIATALSTNGTLITDEVAEKIKGSGITYAGISLDGATAATHDRFRNIPGAFDRAVAAFARCRKAGVRTGVRVTLTKENQGELDALVDLARTLNASRFCLYWLVPCGRGSDAYDRLQLGAQEVTRALSLLYRKAKEIPAEEMEFLTVDAPQDCIHLLQSMERDGSPDLPEARELLASLNGGCSAGERVANVDPRGNVYPCQFARSPAFLIGSIRDRPFSSLWNDSTSPVLARFRTRPPVIDGKCKACTYLSLCGGGCRVRAYARSGDFFSEDPFCYVDDAHGNRVVDP